MKQLRSILDLFKEAPALLVKGVGDAQSTSLTPLVFGLALWVLVSIALIVGVRVVARTRWPLWPWVMFAALAAVVTTAAVFWT